MRNWLSTEEVLQAPAFAAYYQAAVGFCGFLEESDSATPADFLAATQAHLLRLYATGLAMPWVELKSNKEYDDKLSAESLQQVLVTTAARLDEARYYWHVFDPTDEAALEPVCGDLLDDLGDIYKDLKYALLIFQLNLEGCKEIALLDFKHDFEMHWGHHCMNALAAIHFYIKRYRQLVSVS